MTSVTEFRQFAEECLRSAKEAKTEQERKTFLDMARAWTQAADAAAVRHGDITSHQHRVANPEPAGAGRVEATDGKA